MFNSFKSNTLSIWTTETKVFDALREIGEPVPIWNLAQFTPEMVKQGYDMIHHGRTTTAEGKNQSTSVYIICVLIAIIVDQKIQY